MVAMGSPNFKRMRAKCTTTVALSTVHIAIITRPIHLLYGGLENDHPLATVETVSRHCPPTGFPTLQCICESCIVIHFVFLSSSGIIIEEVSISAIKPHILAGFDELEIMFKLPASNISKN